ncbi:hypothetical protein [Streptomyces celluloflavus]|uniref:hypothetical protein n=1 Tax=Streptomyces celluloflavus TaxID=58344 RepID=UPI00368C5182
MLLEGAGVDAAWCEPVRVGAEGGEHPGDTGMPGSFAGDAHCRLDSRAYIVDPPVHLSDPMDYAPPEPVDNCPDCWQYATERAKAFAKGDYTRATDCNIAIRRHPAAHLSELAEVRP